MSIKSIFCILLLGLLSVTHVLAQADTVFSCVGNTAIVEADMGFDRYRWYPAADLQSIGGRRVFYEGSSNTTLFVQQQRYISQNLVVNPDFQAGNTGFTSDYQFVAGGSSNQGTYGLVTSAQFHNPGFSPCTDAISPGELIMAIDGSSNERNAIWCQSFAISPTSSYAFGFELASLSDGNPARLRVRINGEDIGGVLIGDPQACIWKRSLAYWNATGSATAEVCIYDLNESSSGNDFAIDNLSFFELGPVVLDSFYVSLGAQSFGTADIKLCGNDRFTEFGLDLGIGESGVASLMNEAGCDSLLTITAIQGDSLSFNQLIDTLCVGDTLRFDNWLITSDTTLCKTIPAQVGCDTIFCLEVRYFTSENIFATVSNPTCAGDVNGQITLANLAGAGTIQYSWLDGPLGPSRQGLAPGNYTYNAVDQKGCSITESITLTDPQPLAIDDIFTLNVRCSNEQNGFALVDVSGGTGPIELIVERNGSIFNIDTLGLGLYDLTVRDSVGCTLTDNFQIGGPGPVSVSLSGDTLVRLGELANHLVSYQGDNATFSLTYNDVAIDTLLNMGRLNWSPPGEGLLVATVIDENGCEASQSIFVRLQSRDMEFFPNAFSPNEDGVNDRFGPALDPAIIAFDQFIIADRWGNILYQIQDCPIDPSGTCFWDGTAKGKFLDTGVYAYYAVLRLIDGTTIDRRGEVTLVTTRD